MAKTNFKSVNEYIASKRNDVQVIRKRVPDRIRHPVPAAKEAIAAQIAVYKLDGVPVLYFAGWKKHFSLYPASDALVAAFKKELARYELSKGTIRMPLSEPVPVKLIERIARFRAEQLTKRETRSGGRRKGRTAHLERVRRISATLPGVSEKLSHGAPSFFVGKDKGVFAVFADNHHEDGRLALWVPVAEGLQPLLIEDAPDTYFKPPYVGPSGWVGINLDQIRDDALQIHMREAWTLVAGARKKRRPTL